MAYARDLFRQAEESGVKPTLPLLNSMLKVCARAAARLEALSKLEFWGFFPGGGFLFTPPSGARGCPFFGGG